MTSAEDWSDSILRQGDMLRADLVPRNLGLALTCVVFALYLPWLTVLAIYTVCVLCDLSDHFAYRSFRRNPVRSLQIRLLSASAVGLSSYSLLGVMVWSTGDLPLMVAGLLALLGALLNVSTTRSAHLPLGLISGLPPSFGLLFIAIDMALAEGTNPASGAFGVIAALAVSGYFVVALIQNNRAQTNLARARARADAQSLAKSRFISGLSHEIKTPLNAIFGLSQTLAEAPGQGTHAEQARTIERAARRLGVLVEDLADLAMSEEGQLVPRPVTANLRHEVLSWADLIGRTAEEPDIPPDTPELARFDPSLWRKAITHLASVLTSQDRGAAGPAPLAVDCDLGGEGRQLTVTLVPAGYVAETRLARPEPFGEADGTALGGILLSRLAGVLGARVSRLSLPDGRRAARIELPFARLPDMPAPGTQPSGRPLRALVVDDIATNRFVLVQVLKSLGIDSVEVGSGPAALGALNEGPFDVVLLDMNMPGMDGETTFAAIRNARRPWSGIPVIALTAGAVGGQRDRYLALGLDGFVGKPVDRRILWAEIAALCRP
jgi:CheY-like chemotaxis protein/signal transduction histidine kinase